MQAYKKSFFRFLKKLIAFNRSNKSHGNCYQSGTFALNAVSTKTGVSSTLQGSSNFAENNLNRNTLKNRPHMEQRKVTGTQILNSRVLWKI